MDEETKNGQSTVEETETTETTETPKKEEPKTDQSNTEETKVTTFTQEDVDDIVKKRLSKERSKFMKNLGIEDESEIETVANRIKEYDTIKSENETLKQQREKEELVKEIKTAGVDDDFLDYVYDKVEKGENFKDNVAEFVKTNPKLLAENYKQMDSSLGLEGNGGTPNFEEMTTEQYLAWRAKNKL